MHLSIEGVNFRFSFSLSFHSLIICFSSTKTQLDRMISFLKLGRGGVLGQGKGSSSWVKKWLMGILAVTGYESV